MLTALAVAFAFRCGLFNIGGQGQYLVGFIAALWVGTHFEGLPRPLHILLAIARGDRSPAAIWGGIAGILKATVGAHEVISTIMLNWIAIYVGKYLFELGGPLQGGQASLPRSPRSSTPPSSGRSGATSRRSTAGIFIALFALVVYYLLLNRTTLGYEVRAVGFNPEAARYGGISVARSYFLALAIAGALRRPRRRDRRARLAVSTSTSDIDASPVGFTGIAVALLGRNKAVGILLRRACSSARCRSGRRRGSSTRASSTPSSPRTSRR